MTLSGLQQLPLRSVLRFFADRFVDTVFVKLLAPNDNSKNQVYLGPGFQALSLFPIGEIEASSSGVRPIFKAKMDFAWIGDDLSLVRAPNAQVILYPQYPEIRFSGFLMGTDPARSRTCRALMASRDNGRVLLLGVSGARSVIGAVFDPTSTAARELESILPSAPRASDIFVELAVQTLLAGARDMRQRLLDELCRIHRLDWIASKKLSPAGVAVACTSSHCGGLTLEAELGIIPNSSAEPDFLGWEVKQHSSTVITMMTPEPTGGFYRDHGVEAFVRRYGYADRNGVADRLNFGGVHRCNVVHPLTGLTLKLCGFDASTGRISDPEGGIALVDSAGSVAALWPFVGLLSHWNKKHNRAVFVPSKHRTSPSNEYRYGSHVRLGIGTDPLKLLKALELGRIYYDPGIKVEDASSVRPTTKRRSQFRVTLRHLDSLYDKLDLVKLCEA